MTNAVPPSRHDEGQVASETSPLLSSSLQASPSTVLVLHESPISLVDRVKLKRRVNVLLCVFIFVMMLGDNLLPAALLQIFEDVICASRHNDAALSANAVSSDGDIDPCKTAAVQKELALVWGFRLFAPVFAGVLCTVPYALLAERFGRKPVLIASGAGILAALSWVLAVCYWNFTSIRWVWLSGVFLFLGGGDCVTATIVHVMVTDVTDQAERAQIFLLFHSADVLSGFVGPAVSAVLMAKGHTWLVLFLSWGVIFFGTFVPTWFIPETLELRDSFSDHLESTPGPNSEPCATSPPRRLTSINSVEEPRSFVAALRSLIRPLLEVLTSNRQALLLLCVFAPQTAARELFNVIGLQYSSAKLSLPYDRGNLLLSLFEGAQGVFAFLIPPLITRFVANPYGWTAWARDRLYAIMSIGATVLGLLVIAVAPTLSTEVAGLLLVALGSCATGLLMALLASVVQPHQISAVFSVAPMLAMVVRSVLAPVVTALLARSMKLGWTWLGLPFAVMAMLDLGTMVASGFITSEKGQDIIEQDDNATS